MRDDHGLTKLKFGDRPSFLWPPATKNDLCNKWRICTQRFNMLSHLNRNYIGLCIWLC